MRWLEAERGLDFGGDYHALWRWSVDELEEFWRAIWDRFDVQHSGEAEPPCSPSARCRARAGSQGRRAQLRRAHLPRPATRRPSRSCTPPRAASSPRSPGPSCARASPRFAAGLRRARVERRRPGRRLPAQLARGADRLPRRGLDRRHLVVVLARLRRPQRRRPLRPGRAQGAARGRRLHLRRPRLRPHRRRRRAPARDAVPRAHRPRRATSTRTPIPARLANGVRWRRGRGSSGAGAELDFERVAFDHPLWILYSSGTTGLPKAIVQGHGGILLEQLKKSSPCTSTRSPATASSGSPRPAG